MAKSLTREDLADIRTVLGEEKAEQCGGTVAGATITQDFAKQTYTQTLADGTVRVDHRYVTPPKS